MASVSYNSLWIYIYLGSAFTFVADAQCNQKKEAVGVVGDTVDFYICSPPRPDRNEIRVDADNRNSFIVNKSAWMSGWFWDEEKTAEAERYFHIRAGIMNEVDFTTWEVTYHEDDGDLFSEDVELIIMEEGPPALRDETSGQETQIFRGDFYTRQNSTVCITNPDKSGHSDVAVERSSSTGLDSYTAGLTSSFVVSVDGQGGLEQEVVLEVSSLSEGDLGDWRVNITNNQGALILSVLIAATGPPILCPGEQKARTLTVAQGAPLTFTVCVVTPDGMAPSIGEASKYDDSVGDYVERSGVLGNNVSSIENFMYRHDIIVSAHALTEEDFGQWRLSVGSGAEEEMQWLYYDFVLQAEGQATSAATNIIIGVVVVVLIVAVAGLAFVCYRYREAAMAWINKSTADLDSDMEGDSDDVTTRQRYKTAETMLQEGQRDTIPETVANPVYGYSKDYLDKMKAEADMESDTLQD